MGALRARNATVIDGSYPAVSFPKIIEHSHLIRRSQVFFGKFSHKKESLCYASPGELL
jgi:hypothetical protein